MDNKIYVTINCHIKKKMNIKTKHIQNILFIFPVVVNCERGLFAF